MALAFQRARYGSPSGCRRERSAEPNATAQIFLLKVIETPDVRQTRVAKVDSISKPSHFLTPSLVRP